MTAKATVTFELLPVSWMALLSWRSGVMAIWRRGKHRLAAPFRSRQPIQQQTAQRLMANMQRQIVR